MTSKRTTLAQHRHLGWAALIFAPAVLGAKGCDVAVVGSECGGLAGAECGRGEYCDFALDAACGAADQTGTCRDIPNACTRQFAPVCGCDDDTYGNACEANAAGISVASQGACSSVGNACGGLQGLACSDGEFCDFAPGAFCGAADQTGTCRLIPEDCPGVLAPVCGCDDVTYSNSCVANAVGISVASQGECGGAAGATSCGGLLGTACADGEFCNFALDAQCGAADQTGTCEVRPEICTLQFDPVCGCDDQTYSNACAAHAAGVAVALAGECSSPGGFACSGLRGLNCVAGEFCDFAPGAFCGAADETGTCRPIPDVCTLESNPVCGCNDVTYGNACEANAAGVSVANAGACP